LLCECVCLYTHIAYGVIGCSTAVLLMLVTQLLQVRVTEDLVRLRDEETKSIAITTALRADLRKQTRRVAALELDLQRRYILYTIYCFYADVRCHCCGAHW
jgi:hypothetical protein